MNWAAHIPTIDEPMFWVIVVVSALALLGLAHLVLGIGIAVLGGRRRS